MLGFRGSTFYVATSMKPKLLRPFFKSLTRRHEGRAVPKENPIRSCPRKTLSSPVMVDPGRCTEVLAKAMLMWVQLEEAPAYFMDASDVQCDVIRRSRSRNQSVQAAKKNYENGCFDRRAGLRVRGCRNCFEKLPLRETETESSRSCPPGANCKPLRHSPLRQGCAAWNLQTYGILSSYPGHY